MDSCGNCKNRDEFGFCEKLVIDTRWCVVENEKRIKSYYIAERDEDECRTSFIVPSDFKCIHHSKK